MCASKDNNLSKKRILSSQRNGGQCASYLDLPHSPKYNLSDSSVLSPNITLITEEKCVCFFLDYKSK